MAEKDAAYAVCENLKNHLKSLEPRSRLRPYLASVIEPKYGISVENQV